MVDTLSPTVEPTKATWSERLQRLYDNRLIIAGILAIMLVCYFWNAPRKMDYPEYDETYYLRRAISVLEGDIVDANLGNLRNSPMMVMYYAGWYSLLHSSAVYIAVFISGVCLMAYTSYLLFLRHFNPLLSGAFSLLIVVASMPQLPDDMRFTVGTALLWFSIFLLGGRVLSRGMALLVMILAIYVRPEYLSCLVVLLPGLAYYEWRQIRRRRQKRTYTMLVYAPAVIILLFTGIRLWQLSSYEEPRIIRTIPFSYAVYTQHFQPERIDQTKTMSDQTVFAEDFPMPGKVTLTAELLSMATHPNKSIPYLVDTTLRFWGAFSAVISTSWVWHPGIDYLLFPTLANTLGFALVVAIFAGISLWAYRSAKRRGDALPQLPHMPSALGYAALVTLIPWMLLANPDERAFMILPLVLLPVGIGITAIAYQLRRFYWLPLVGILAMFVLVPRPFTAQVATPRRDTLDFIRANVPPYSAVMGTPVESYANSLYADHFVIEGIEGTNFGDPVLVNAYKAHPELQYVLFTYFYPQDYYTRWFTEWNAAYPDLHWQLIAEKPDLQLKLYRLTK